jgi:hypothetical protein
VLNITYGDVRDGETDFMHLGDRNVEIISKALSGQFLVDYLPICEYCIVVYPNVAYGPHANRVKYVPEWMPGAGFKRQAAIWKKQTYESIELPFNMVKKRKVLHTIVLVSQSS